MKSSKLKRDLTVVQLCETHPTSLAFKGHLTLLKRHFATLGHFSIAYQKFHDVRTTISLPMMGLELAR